MAGVTNETDIRSFWNRSFCSVVIRVNDEEIMAQLEFDSYKFSVTALTEAGVVTPLTFDVQRTDDGLTATSKACVLFGDTRRPYSGEMVVKIENTGSQGIRWHVDASMNDLIKGVKVNITPIPGISLNAKILK